MAQGADGADAALEVVSRDLRSLKINRSTSNYQVQISSAFGLSINEK
jgi:hypothetical protein